MFQGTRKTRKLLRLKMAYWQYHLKLLSREQIKTIHIRDEGEREREGERDGLTIPEKEQAVDWSIAIREESRAEMINIRRIRR